WGQKYGMDLGRDKCGVMLCKDEDNNVDVDLGEIEAAHREAVYSTPEGTIQTVTSYKYLGMTMDEDLGDPRKVVVSERSMEYNFTIIQSKKGLKILHTLRPFLTDCFCPIQLKVALVRNLIYPSMLYGVEFIDFQKLHAKPMQRIVNIAVKWIMGLARSNTSTDAFTLSYKLGLLPIFLEMSAARARLGYKLDIGHEKLKTWIQQLFDN
ncbi:hypothetical protein V8E53_014069, partial [Lactarius tabidus]